MINQYEQYGCTGRDEYLRRLSDDYGVDLDEIRRMAECSAPEHDFTALRQQVEALADMNYELEMGLEMM
ncbi:hypothetical protein LJC34_07560 [Oscillospiraceae bacterium OttesenSCG-928-G22]|nr:hypothetical protein [Oscillospiraceae bacterium OttesenSCG-928-G22]